MSTAKKSTKDKSKPKIKPKTSVSNNSRTRLRGPCSWLAQKDHPLDLTDEALASVFVASGLFYSN
jgi:hypothetical protein